MNTISPFSQLKDWHRSQQTRNYDDALAVFQQDLATIQQWDQASTRVLTESEDPFLAGQLCSDKDDRPGEVEVDIGSLRSNEQGFELRRRLPEVKLNDWAYDRGGSRSYQVNENGTVAVFNDLEGVKTDNQKFLTQPSRERYVIDTERGIISDYSREVRKY